MDINDDRRPMAIYRIKEMLGDMQGKIVGILGLSFKPNTDDMRDAPAIDIARSLLNAGAQVRAYDPVAMNMAAPQLPGVDMMSDPYAVADGADALMLITEWNEFKQLDLERVSSLMRQPIVFDGRNIYDPELMAKYGFIYRGLGRGYKGQKLAETNVFTTAS
jgi:UDPglucose 6-dehydrogenase